MGKVAWDKQIHQRTNHAHVSRTQCERIVNSSWYDLGQSETIKCSPPGSLGVCLDFRIPHHLMTFCHVEVPIKVEHGHDEIGKATETAIIADTASLEPVPLF